mgnify:CR=1 FL=1
MTLKQSTGSGEGTEMQLNTARLRATPEFRAAQRSFPVADFERAVRAVLPGVNNSAEFFDRLFWKILGTRATLEKEFKDVKFDPGKLRSATDREGVDALSRLCEMAQAQFFAGKTGLRSLPREIRSPLRRLTKDFPDADLSVVVREAVTVPNRCSVDVLDKIFWKIIKQKPDLEKKFNDARMVIDSMPAGNDRDSLQALSQFSQIIQIEAYAESHGIHTEDISPGFHAVIRSVERRFSDVDFFKLAKRIAQQKNSIAVSDIVFWDILNSRPELA